MSLAMKKDCQICGHTLDAQSEAYICVHECTFCKNCTEERGHICPNCSGELVRRPRTPLTTAAACPLG
ncbi:DUF1272 domain-containing protein [Paenibacillus chitinolyticus]|uniref:DUF1272 domain-containing protein n=1 Tax=Paenibacillus chitinolyticus TaxID=79263 RepID=UPI0036DEF3A2